jgi:hypothetical protein
VVIILVPGRFAYPVMQGKQGVGRLLSLNNRICGRKKFTTKAKKAHEDRGLKAFFIPSCSRRAAARLGAPSWLLFLFPVVSLSGDAGQAGRRPANIFILLIKNSMMRNGFERPELSRSISPEEFFS